MFVKSEKLNYFNLSVTEFLIISLSILKKNDTIQKSIFTPEYTAMANINVNKKKPVSYLL